MNSSSNFNGADNDSSGKLSRVLFSRHLSAGLQHQPSLNPYTVETLHQQSLDPHILRTSHQGLLDPVNPQTFSRFHRNKLLRSLSEHSQYSNATDKFRNHTSMFNLSPRLPKRISVKVPGPHLCGNFTDSNNADASKPQGAFSSPVSVEKTITASPSQAASPKSTDHLLIYFTPQKFSPIKKNVSPVQPMLTSPVLPSPIQPITLSNGAAPGALSQGAAPGALSQGAASGALSQGAAPGALSQGAAPGALSQGAASGALSQGAAPGALSQGAAPGALSQGAASPAQTFTSLHETPPVARAGQFSHVQPLAKPSADSPELRYNVHTMPPRAKTCSNMKATNSQFSASTHEKAHCTRICQVKNTMKTFEFLSQCEALSKQESLFDAESGKMLPTVNKLPSLLPDVTDKHTSSTIKNSLKVPVLKNVTVDKIASHFASVAVKKVPSPIKSSVKEAVPIFKGGNVDKIASHFANVVVERMPSPIKSTVKDTIPVLKDGNVDKIASHFANVVVERMPSPIKSTVKDTIPVLKDGNVDKIASHFANVVVERMPSPLKSTVKEAVPMFKCNNIDKFASNLSRVIGKKVSSPSKTSLVDLSDFKNRTVDKIANHFANVDDKHVPSPIKNPENFVLIFKNKSVDKITKHPANVEQKQSSIRSKLKDDVPVLKGRNVDLIASHLAKVVFERMPSPTKSTVKSAVPVSNNVNVDKVSSHLANVGGEQKPRNPAKDGVPVFKNRNVEKIAKHFANIVLEKVPSPIKSTIKDGHMDKTSHYSRVIFEPTRSPIKNKIKEDKDVDNDASHLARVVSEQTPRLEQHDFIKTEFKSFKMHGALEDNLEEDSNSVLRKQVFKSFPYPSVLNSVESITNHLQHLEPKLDKRESFLKASRILEAHLGKIINQVVEKKVVNSSFKCQINQLVSQEIKLQTKNSFLKLDQHFESQKFSMPGSSSQEPSVDTLPQEPCIEMVHKTSDHLNANTESVSQKTHVHGYVKMSTTIKSLSQKINWPSHLKMNSKFEHKAHQLDTPASSDKNQDDQVDDKQSRQGEMNLNQVDQREGNSKNASLFPELQNQQNLVNEVEDDKHDLGKGSAQPLYKSSHSSVHSDKEDASMHQPDLSEVEEYFAAVSHSADLPDTSSPNNSQKPDLPKIDENISPASSLATEELNVGNQEQESWNLNILPSVLPYFEILEGYINRVVDELTHIFVDEIGRLREVAAADTARLASGTRPVPLPVPVQSNKARSKKLNSHVVKSHSAFDSHDKFTNAEHSKHSPEPTTNPEESSLSSTDYNSLHSVNTHSHPCNTDTDVKDNNLGDNSKIISTPILSHSLSHVKDVTKHKGKFLCSLSHEQLCTRSTYKLKDCSTHSEYGSCYEVSAPIHQDVSEVTIASEKLSSCFEEKDNSDDSVHSEHFYNICVLSSEMASDSALLSPERIQFQTEGLVDDLVNVKLVPGDAVNVLPTQSASYTSNYQKPDKIGKNSQFIMKRSDFLDLKKIMLDKMAKRF